MKRKSRRSLVILSLLLVPLAISAGIILAKGARIVGGNPQPTPHVALNHPSVVSDNHSFAGKLSNDARRVKLDTDHTDDSQANAHTDDLCPECLESHSPITQDSHATGTQSSESARDQHVSTFAHIGFDPTPGFNGLGGSHKSQPRGGNRNSSVAGGGHLQQLADNCTEGACKSSGPDPESGGTSFVRPDKTVTVPEPSITMLFLIGTLGLWAARRISRRAID